MQSHYYRLYYPLEMSKGTAVEAVRESDPKDPMDLKGPLPKDPKDPSPKDPKDAPPKDPKDPPSKDLPPQPPKDLPPKDLPPKDLPPKDPKASEPNSTEKVVVKEVKTSGTEQTAKKEEKKEDPQLRARKVEAKTNPPEQGTKGTKEVKGIEQVEESDSGDQDQSRWTLDQDHKKKQEDLYFFLWQQLSKSMIYGMEQIQKLESYVAKYPAIDQLLVSLEQKTKVKKIYLLYGIVATVITWLMFGYGAQLLCNAIGFAYPAYCSVKALESSKKDDDTQWLVYWVVFAMFSVLEFFSDILVGWVPFYWFVKCVFLVWLMSPLDGSSVIYNRVILPLFHKNQSKIDSYLSKGKGIADQAFNEAAKIAAEVESKKSE